MFDVRWTDDAIAELSVIWMDAHPEDRVPITEAVNEIDEMLSASAETAGESRAAEFRMLVIDTMAVHYRVWHDERQVQVANVWRTTSVRR
ncbi:MAG: hypothetical protein AB7U20_05675 [Planctomycetaceae bacterium]